VHDGLGNTAILNVQGYTSGYVITATSTSALPISMQNVPTTNWSYVGTLPGVTGPAKRYWYRLTSTYVEIPTQVPAAAIGQIVRAQNNDIITLTHQLMAPIQLLHYGDQRWQAKNYLPGVSISPPSGLGALIGYSSTLHTFQYGVTAVSAETGEESLISNPVICLGNYPSNGSGSNGPPNTISWSPVPGAKSYNIYLLNGSYGSGSSGGSGIPGLIGSTAGTFFLDTGLIPDVADQPPVLLPFLQTINDYPGVCGYFQGRLLFGNSINQPQSFWGTRIQQFNNLCVSTPLVDNDAFLEVIAGNKVQPIQAFVDLGVLLIHTANAEYQCLGVNGTRVITASQINCVVQGGNGSQPVQPVVIGNTDIFVQALGNLVRDLRFDIYTQQYDGKDVSIYTPDLFIGRSVVQMAWQQVKNSIVWFVMSDGTMLSLTYIREEQMWGWGTHDTGQGDLITQVIVLPENGQDVVYLGVNRFVNGTWTMGIEKLANRDLMDASWLTDSFFCDSALVFDGRNSTTTTLTLSSQTGGWTPNDTFELTASTAIFAATDAPAGNPQGVGNQFILRQVNAEGIDTARLYFTVTAYIDSEHVQCTCDDEANVPAWAQGVATTVWGKAQHAFSGLDHLDGENVSLLGDGNVLSSPLNPITPNPWPIVTVNNNGAIVIPNNLNVMVLCAGLPMVAELTTLPLENQKGASILGKQANLKELAVTFFASRGGLYGQLAPPGDRQILTPWRQRRLELLGSPDALFSGTVRVNSITGNFGIKGQGACQAIVNQSDPLPLGVSAITLMAEVGD
jgi:hypothetical protein